jgi:hypothetical protein
MILLGFLPVKAFGSISGAGAGAFQTVGRSSLIVKLMMEKVQKPEAYARCNANKVAAKTDWRLYPKGSRGHLDFERARTSDVRRELFSRLEGPKEGVLQSVMCFEHLLFY